MSITDPPNGSTPPVSPEKTYTKLDPFKPPTAEEILKREAERAKAKILKLARLSPFRDQFRVSPGEVGGMPASQPPADGPPAPEEIPTRAVWIVHGMGQQVPFETIDNLAEGIMSVTQPFAANGFDPQFFAVKIGDSLVERVELKVCFGGKPVEVHLYEAYWAPLTEGEVKLADVISFLFDGSLRGVLNSFKKFRRSIFGDLPLFTINWRAPFEILLALATVIALMVLNLVIGAAGAQHYGLSGTKLQGLVCHWDALTTTAGALSVVALMFGAILFFAGLTKPPSLPDWGKWIVCYFTWAAFFLTLVTVIAGAARLGYLSAFTSGGLQQQPNWMAIREWTNATALVAGLLVAFALVARSWELSGLIRKRTGVVFVIFFVLSFSLFVLSFVCFLASAGLPGELGSRFGELGFLPAFLIGVLKSSLWIWPFLILLSYEVRELLVQYVGDVAVYVTPNKLDRFCQIRQQIKDLAYKTASNVYFAEKDGDFLYDKIAVVGHSLGSVIAYDTLNRLINEDQLAFTRFNVTDRTCLLETFGSPLDKTAFFFTVQGKDTFAMRERLAAAVQPLISDTESRKEIPWVNVYSRNDIISGKLKLYDFPDGHNPGGAQTVQHVKDPNAIVPLVAHVDFWNNTTVWEQLCAELVK
jgi:hypothetical protein